jgi:hypothetical protein
MNTSDIHPVTDQTLGQGDVVHDILSESTPK